MTRLDGPADLHPPEQPRSGIVSDLPEPDAGIAWRT